MPIVHIKEDLRIIWVCEQEGKICHSMKNKTSYNDFTSKLVFDSLPRGTYLFKMIASDFRHPERLSLTPSLEIKVIRFPLSIMEKARSLRRCEIYHD